MTGHKSYAGTTDTLTFCTVKYFLDKKCYIPFYYFIQNDTLFSYGDMAQSDGSNCYSFLNPVTKDSLVGKITNLQIMVALQKISHDEKLNVIEKVRFPHSKIKVQIWYSKLILNYWELPCRPVSDPITFLLNPNIIVFNNIDDVFKPVKSVELEAALKSHIGLFQDYSDSRYFKYRNMDCE